MNTVDLTLSDLAHHRVWVGWREELRDGRKTKVPFDPATGRLAESDNPETWATRGEAEFWAVEKRGGGGIMFSPIGDHTLAGIDLDTCRGPAIGKIEAWHKRSSIALRATRKSARTKPPSKYFS